MINIIDSEFEKLDANKQKLIYKAANKLESLINSLNNFSDFIINNPVIHDSYGDFYVYKYVGLNCSIRLLYKYKNNNILEIHKYHFKKGDKDNSKYIEYFENYVNDFEEDKIGGAICN